MHGKVQTNLMQEEFFHYDIALSDDTTIQVLKEGRRAPSGKSASWIRGAAQAEEDHRTNQWFWSTTVALNRVKPRKVVDGGIGHAPSRQALSYLLNHQETLQNHWLQNY